MPKKKFTHHYCTKCDLDFFVTAVKRFNNKNMFCPGCGKTSYIEKITQMYLPVDLHRNTRWTDNEIEIMIMGVEMGYTWQEIAESMKTRTEVAIRQKYHYMQKKGQAGVDPGLRGRV